MKTLLTINNLIEEQVESILELEKDKKLNKAKIKRGRNNLTYPRFIKSYLETIDLIRKSINWHGSMRGRLTSYHPQQRPS